SYINVMIASLPLSSFFNAGEANIEFYEKIKEIFEADTTNTLHVICGPELSTYAYYKEVSLQVKSPNAKSWIAKEDISDEEVLKLHPLFYLKNKYPDRVSLHLKKTNHDNHFALIEAGNVHYLYIEEPHDPLDEKGVLFIANPNKTLWNKYKDKQEAIMGDAIELKEIKDFKRVQFAYFVEELEFYTEVA
ncbi:MAG: hypothetical protein Q7S59_09995, partial [Sulfurimonas sp.]|nr:hypothetical protein [Sulfurimonas sp.]